GIPQNDRKAEREYEDFSKQRGHRYTSTAAKGGHEEAQGRGRRHHRYHDHIADFGHGPIAREILPLRQRIAARESPPDQRLHMNEEISSRSRRFLSSRHKFVPSVGRPNPAGEHRCQSALTSAAD